MKTFKKKTMGMNAIVGIADDKVNQKDIKQLFDFFKKVDSQFSTYKKDSEVEEINRGELSPKQYSREMRKILKLADKTKKETVGFFDVYNKGRLDPSGIVKGYAINEASRMLKKMGYKNYFVEIAGDIDIRGNKPVNKKWSVGIKNPFNKKQIIKVLNIKDKGVATSGNYTRGEHIYNPKVKTRHSEVSSITVIGPNVFEADRFATAAFAMGVMGIDFIEKTKGLEGYMINNKGVATYTSGFQKYL